MRSLRHASWIDAFRVTPCLGKSGVNGQADAASCILCKDGGSFGMPRGKLSFMKGSSSRMAISSSSSEVRRFACVGSASTGNFAGSGTGSGQCGICVHKTMMVHKSAACVGKF